MPTNKSHQLIGIKKFLGWFLSKVVGALSFLVINVVLRVCNVVTHRVSPKQIAKNALQRHLLEAVELVDVLDLAELWRDASVHAEVLVVHDAGDGHGVEALHEDLVGLLVERVDDLLPEGEVLRHVAALVVASQHDHALRVVDLDGVSKRHLP
jgi:hypothetical protein